MLWSQKDKKLFCNGGILVQKGARSICIRPKKLEEAMVRLYSVTSHYYLNHTAFRCVLEGQYFTYYEGFDTASQHPTAKKVLKYLSNLAALIVFKPGYGANPRLHY